MKKVTDRKRLERTERRFRELTFTIIGVLTAAVITIVSWLPMWPDEFLTDKYLHSFLLLFMGLVIGQIVDTNRKMRLAVEEASHLAELTAEEESSAELRKPVESIIRAAAAIEQGRVSCFRKQAVRQVEEFAEKMNDIGGGILVVPEHDFHPCVQDALREARESIKATAMFTHKDGFKWWEMEAGKNYWNLNLEFLKKASNPKIQRVFIYKEGRLEDPHNDELRTLVRKQSEAGVEVSTVSMEVLANEKVAPFDFGVFDQSFAWERTTDGAGHPYQLRFMVNESQVNKRIQSFDHICSFARTYQLTRAPLPRT